MTHKRDVHVDLLHVIAYGPSSAKVPAAGLLFLYWLSLNPTQVAHFPWLAFRFHCL